MALPIRRAKHTNRDEAPDTTTTSPPVMRPDGFGELDRLNRQLAGYLDFWRQGANLLDGLFTPPADVEETDDAYVVDIELPGVGKEDIDIEIAGRRLTVRGERKGKERIGILRRRERTIGRFQFEVTLPGNVEEDGVAATLDHGVLAVRVPKPPSERARRIEVH